MSEKGPNVKRLIIPLLAVLCLLSACGGPAEPVQTAAPFGCSAWLPYWDADAALKESLDFTDSFESLVCFEAYFDTNGDWLLPPDSERILEQLRARGTSVCLSLVNDIQQADQSFVHKSRDFLEQNLLTPEARQAHIEQILSLIRSTGVDALEIDYENFKKNTELWSGFTEFLGALYPVLNENGVRLRVVMESNAPEYAVFPEGPVYICMCYNLYGTHSGPGPKADEAFLRKLGESWKAMPGEVHMAFATGGFLWAGDKAEKALTEQQALRWLEQNGKTPVRDRKSGALWTSIRSGGEKHTIWYADGATLAFWRSTLQSMGYAHFDLFRLGGNTADSLAAFLGRQ